MRQPIAPMTCHSSNPFGMNSVAHSIIQLARQQPADTKHIDGRAHSAVTEAVFALAEFTGAMIDRDLDQSIPGAFDQRRNEPVHALERDECPDTFAAHCLERAPGVAHAVLRKTAPDKVRNSARKPFYE